MRKIRTKTKSGGQENGENIERVNEETGTGSEHGEEEG
jgi:hypothetical protein